MPLANVRDYYRMRAYQPGPLVYPFTPLTGNIPISVLDRLVFRAYQARAAGDDLGVFMIRSWEEFRFPHSSLMYALLDQGLLRRFEGSRGNSAWEWSKCTTQRTARSASEDGTDALSFAGFFDDSETSEFSSSVVVAPRISPTYSTPTKKNGY